MSTNNDRVPASGQLMPLDMQSALLKGRQKSLVALLRSSHTWLGIITIGLLLTNLFSMAQWKKAERKFEENVRVTYVKLSPNGTYAIDYENEEASRPEYFKTTVESKLSEWIEKRYSKRASTIRNDYGFANLMMGPELSTSFLKEQKAAEVAAQHSTCADCPQETVMWRTFKDLDDDYQPGSKKDKQYTTLAFALRKTTNKDHQTTGCRNLIITLIWRFRPMSEVVSRRDELRYNPLGQEILRADLQEDPSPISLEQCTERSVK